MTDTFDFSPNSITPGQRDYLFDLVMEADGSVDEDWLNSLTKDQASEEIEKYKGFREDRKWWEEEG